MDLKYSEHSLNTFSNESLKIEIQRIRDFYLSHSINPEGGFYQSLYEDGSVRKDGINHLVSSCRMTVNFARSKMVLGDLSDLDIVRHGLKYIETQHHRSDGLGYHWLLEGDRVLDEDQYCYGYAFLLLTYANAYQAGIQDAKSLIDNVHNQMCDYFWDDQAGLFADQYNIEQKKLAPYRGQNANMHACEALIAAFAATQKVQYLEKALLIAKNIVLRQTETTEGLIWEHYDQHWTPDFTYNINDPKNLYKPWGYQPGHFTEWAKLLLLLYRYSNQDWLVEKAGWLLDSAWKHSWDTDKGGMFYGFAPNFSPCDTDKYFWVQAESLAAFTIASKVIDKRFSEQAKSLMGYVEKAFVRPTTRVWWRVLDASGTPADKWVALPGAKCDYHTIGSYYDILQH